MTTPLTEDTMRQVPATFRACAGALVIGLGASLLAPSTGCEAPGSGVGDPCEPENVPPDGFRQSDVYLETDSRECKTRVCMVFHLEGDPTVEQPCGAGADPEECINYVGPVPMEASVYCTRRCGGGDANGGRCGQCPDGFECCPVLAVGPADLRGSYCVRAGSCGTLPERE